MRYIHEALDVEGCPGDPDNESGIASQNFDLRYGYSYNDEVIYFHAGMEPDETVQDASESEFPNADFMLSIEDFKRLVKMFLRFDERLSDRNG